MREEGGKESPGQWERLEVKEKLKMLWTIFPARARGDLSLLSNWAYKREGSEGGRNEENRSRSKSTNEGRGYT